MARQSGDRGQLGSEANEWGHDAEVVARDYLISQGYTIREMNWRIGSSLEIDIIAQMEGVIIFVEVKARKDKDPVEAVDRKKRQKMVSGANAYLNTLPHLYEYRFDIITLTGTRESYELNHYPDAFLPPLNGRINCQSSI